MRRLLGSCALLLASVALVALAFSLPDLAARRQDEAAGGVRAYQMDGELQLTVGSGTTFAERLALCTGFNAVSVSDASQFRLTAAEVCELAGQALEPLLPAGGWVAVDATSVQARMAWDGVLERTVPIWTFNAELWSENQEIWYGMAICHLDDETGGLLMTDIQNGEGEEPTWLWSVLEKIAASSEELQAEASRVSRADGSMGRSPEYALAAVRWMLGEDWTLEADSWEHWELDTWESPDSLSAYYHVRATRGEETVLLPVVLRDWGMVINSSLW